ncbi:hypothetical protein D3C59_00685 [Streptomyces sp. SHP22-7]|nr:hypothetical protein D3C59_00685 [Streptomyces sp. SHP22-7]
MDWQLLYGALVHPFREHRVIASVCELGRRISFPIQDVARIPHERSGRFHITRFLQHLIDLGKHLREETASFRTFRLVSSSIDSFLMIV